MQEKTIDTVFLNDTYCLLADWFGRDRVEVVVVVIEGELAKDTVRFKLPFSTLRTNTFMSRRGWYLLYTCPLGSYTGVPEKHFRDLDAACQWLTEKIREVNKSLEETLAVKER